MRVYVAASTKWLGKVKAIHERLRAHGIECVSAWVDAIPCDSSGVPLPEDFERHTAAELKAAHAANYAAIDGSDVVVFLADSPAREGFFEAFYAMINRKPVVWVGRDTLSTRIGAFPTVVRFKWEQDALSHVVAMVDEKRRGAA
jgi:hypothetical protein